MAGSLERVHKAAPLQTGVMFWGRVKAAILFSVPMGASQGYTWQMGTVQSEPCVQTPGDLDAQGPTTRQPRSKETKAAQEDPASGRVFSCAAATGAARKDEVALTT